MTIIASIDGTVSPRLVYLHVDTVGTSLHPMDIYKEMRTLRRNDESLRKFDVFMQGLGKDPKGAGKFTERFVKLLDCRIVPYDTSHILTITGVLITDDELEGILAFDKAPLSPTTSVDIAYVPKQVEIIEIGTGLDAAQDAKLTQISGEVKFIERWVHIDTELVAPGIGTQEEPFNNLDDALNYMEPRNLRRIHTISDLTVDRNLKNFSITGIGEPVIDCAGFDLDGSQFDHCTMKGNSLGRLTVQDCFLFTSFQMYGFAENCALGGVLEIMGDTLIMGCYSGVTGLGYASLKLTSGNAQVRFFIGSIAAINCTGGDHSIGNHEGRFIADPTNTAGLIHVRGTPFSIDDTSGAGCNVLDETESEKVTNLPVANKKELLGTTSFP